MSGPQWAGHLSGTLHDLASGLVMLAFVAGLFAVLYGATA